MRTDRLLAEMLYLLQHGRTSARQLSARFEVSCRTILRDMDALCMAGVPVISYEGVHGGFALADGYHIDGNFADQADAALISTALQALSTAVTDDRLLHAMEKYRALHQGMPQMHIDLSALSEDQRIQNNLAALRRAIHNRRAVRITYVNTAGERAAHTVEPLELHYRWYAWYLHAYSRKKQAVLTYKLVRMDEIVETDEPIGEHINTAPPADDRPQVQLVIRCKETARVPLIEYLHAQPLRQLDDGDWLFHITVPSGERFWRGALLSLGGDVQILAPKNIAEEFCNLARAVLETYPT